MHTQTPAAGEKYDILARGSRRGEMVPVAAVDVRRFSIVARGFFARTVALHLFSTVADAFIRMRCAADTHRQQQGKSQDEGEDTHDRALEWDARHWKP